MDANKAVSDKLFSAAIDCMTSSGSGDSRITTAAGLPENNLSVKAST